MTLSLVNVTPGSSYSTPGPQSVIPYNTQSNLLVLLAAWDVSAATTSGSPVVPAGSVDDSAENWWRLAADTGSLVPGCRAAAWVCSNALQITRWLSFCPQGYVTSFIFLVAELSGLPASYWPLIDFQVPLSSKSTSGLTPAGTATVADNCFTLAAVGATAPTITGPGAGWTAIGSGSVGGASPNGVQLSAAYGQFGAGAVSAAWSYSASGQAAALVFGLTQASNLPVQINPNFPRVFVEAAFGATPGDPTAAILDTAWTDISSYAIGEAGQVGISSSGGQQYELGQPEAGTLTIAMNNQTGAFNPLNTGSPFYPNVKIGVPVRVSAQFSGQRYPVKYAYVERWPQDWPDFPQWGWSKMVASDSVGVASAVNMPSAVQGDILADNPYLCLPFGEQYTTSQNTVNGVLRTPAGPAGLSAVNTAAGNQQTGTYVDGDFFPVVAGQSLGLLGDSGTGMGQSAGSAAVAGIQRGPGVQYGPDTGMPGLAASGAGDISIDLWFSIPAPSTLPSGTLLQQLFNLLVLPSLSTAGVSPVGVGGQLLLVGAQLASNSVTNTTLYAYPSWSASRVTGSAVVSEGTVHHLAVVLSGGQMTVWLDGVQDTGMTVSGIPYPRSAVAITFGQCVFSFGNESQGGLASNWNYTMAYGTLYPYALTAARIAAHYSSGFTGYSGDTMIQRAGRYIAWSRLNLGLAGPVVPDHLQLGPAYSVGGAPLSGALNNDATSSGGMWYASASGALVVLPRPSLYNLPVALVFGDNPASGEIPYLPDATGFDYDNTYLQNSVQASLDQGPNSLAVPTIRSPGSVAQYFNRGPLQQTVSAQSIQDALDRANWSLNKLQQPSVRVRSMVVNAAARPAVFPSVLGADIATVALIKRRPLGPATNSYSLPVRLGKIQHDIGPGVWTVTYQAYPYVPENSVLELSWSFTVSSTPASSSYFIATVAQAASISVGDQFTDTSNLGTTFTVTGISAPSSGFQNVSFSPAASVVMSSPDVVAQVGDTVLGSNSLGW